MKAVRDFLGTAGFQVVLVLSGLAQSVVLTRFLGTADYGVYRVLMNCVVAMQLFAMFGLDVAALHFISNDRARAQRVSLNAVVCGLAAGLFFFLWPPSSCRRCSRPSRPTPSGGTTWRCRRTSAWASLRLPCWAPTGCFGIT